MADPAVIETPPAAPVTPPPSAAVVTPPPVIPAAAPAPVKSLLEKAGEPVVVPTVGEMYDKATVAINAYNATPTPELKTAMEKAVADAKSANEAAKTAPPAPLAATKLDIAKFVVPEGITLDKASLEAFLPVAEKMGLTQEKAQELVALQATLTQKQIEADAKAWDDSQAKQVEDTKKALGAKWEEELSFAAKARDTFFSKSAIAELNKWGISNNVHFIQSLIQIGKQLSPEKIVEGEKGPEANSAEAVAKNMFPTMKK